MIIPKNKLEQVHIALSNYEGKNLIDIRSYSDFDGEGHKPTKKGVSLPIDKIDDVIKGLTEARAEAVQKGWIK